MSLDAACCHAKTEPRAKTGSRAKADGGCAGAARLRHRTRRGLRPDPRSPAFGAALLAISLLATRPDGAQAATVEVTVSGVRPDGSTVLASLCSGGLDRSACTRGQKLPADAGVLAFVFPDVEPGRYAAIAFQDVEGDGVLRRSRMGRPLEPYGLSNGAGRSHRPTFDQAAVRVGATGLRIPVRLERPDSP